jgi:hypothetical protein
VWSGAPSRADVYSYTTGINYYTAPATLVSYFTQGDGSRTTGTLEDMRGRYPDAVVRNT